MIYSLATYNELHGITKHGTDLHINTACPVCTRVVSLAGVDDDVFFDVTNKNPRIIEHICGHILWFRWYKENGTIKLNIIPSGICHPRGQ